MMHKLAIKKKRGRGSRERLTLKTAISQASDFFQDLPNSIKKLSPTWQASIPLACMVVLATALSASAQDASLEEVTASLKVGLDTVWVVVAAILVIFMNAGFGMLETGFCRQKNAVNILSKNLIVFALSTLSFYVIGFGLMFGNGNGFMGTEGLFLLSGADSSPALGDAYEGAYGALNWTGVPLAAKFLFQVAFAGTAATIVSGAVAERIKYIDFIIFSLLLVGISYPITGHWVWGGGWLYNYGFWDFAGSTVVHSVGGWAALMGAAILGPRLGKYQDGQTTALPGHNMAIATLGCLILWIGWFGFNPGSTMAADPSIAHIALTTNLAAAAGGVAATVTSWTLAGKPDLSMSINGILAGLVAITAPCAFVGYFPSIIIGLIGGVIVVFSVYFFDSIKIDDPVGATSVHLVNGFWGTLAVGLFGNPAIYDGGPVGLFYGGGINQLVIQFVGALSVGGFTVLFSAVVWVVLKSVFGLRVAAEEELAGLDIGEHGMEAYAGFVKDASALPTGAAISGETGSVASAQ